MDTSDPLEWGEAPFLLPNTSPALLVLLNSARISDITSSLTSMTSATATALGSHAGMTVTLACRDKEVVKRTRMLVAHAVPAAQVFLFDPATMGDPDTKRAKITLRSFTKIAAFVGTRLDPTMGTSAITVLKTTDGHQPLVDLFSHWDKDTPAPTTVVDTSPSNGLKSISVSQLQAFLTGQAVVRQSALAPTHWRNILVDTATPLFVQMCTDMSREDLARNLIAIHTVAPKKPGNLFDQDQPLYAEMSLDFVIQAFASAINAINETHLHCGQLVF